MERGARTLFASLARFRDSHPGHLLLWPGHGPGSACGKNLGGLPVTSLAYERLTNWGVRCTDEGEFVREVLAGQPEPPAYFKHMKRLNKEGPPIFGSFPPRGPASSVTSGRRSVRARLALPWTASVNVTACLTRAPFSTLAG